MAQSCAVLPQRSGAGLILFCHEGPWHKVDRIWTIRTNGQGLEKIHSRKMEMEIAGHEFFGHDGKAVWYDLQTPKGRSSGWKVT